MKDRIKGYLALFFFALALILPLISLLAGGIRWDWEQGSFVTKEWDWRISLLAASFTFLLCFGLGTLFALRVRKPIWLEILLPFASGILYSITNVVPLPVDDALVSVAGAIASYVMTLRRFADAPRWIVAPPLAAALYTLVGEFIPGPVDELAVSALAAIVSSTAASRSARRARARDAAQEGPPTERGEFAVKAPGARTEE